MNDSLRWWGCKPPSTSQWWTCRTYCDVQLMLEQIFHNRGERQNEDGTEAAGSFARSRWPSLRVLCSRGNVPCGCLPGGMSWTAGLQNSIRLS
jgi:hypothetical protein